MKIKSIFRRYGLIAFLLLQTFIYAESQEMSFGNFFFSLTPKILDNGSILDLGFGLHYTDTLSGELRFRYTAIEGNEELDSTDSSLNAMRETSFEIFFLPALYNFIRNNDIRLWAGAGLFYEYNELREKGFFNMSILESLTPPRERVNSYTNDFSMHVIGPLIDAGLQFNSQNLNSILSFGIVPVFFLSAEQKTGIDPLMNPLTYNNSQNTRGSPYVYLSLNSIIYRYFNIVLSYDLSYLEYKVIDFDVDSASNFYWKTTDRTVMTQSFMIEGSILLPLGNDLSFQAGYGVSFDSIRLDGTSAVSSNKQYIILSTRVAR